MGIRQGKFEKMVTFRPFKGGYLVIPASAELLENNRGRVETQPRCKIQYPMKNRSEDAYKMPNGCITMELFFIPTIVITINKKILRSDETQDNKLLIGNIIFSYTSHLLPVSPYVTRLVKLLPQD